MISRGKQQQQAVRKARLAAALRENLKRRKAQARGRAQSEANDDTASAASGTEHQDQAPDFRRNRGRE
jgi:hypothetical protein